MTDQPIVEAYGVKFTTDAWARFTWQQICVATCCLTGVALILWGMYSFTTTLSAAFISTPDGVLISSDNPVPFPHLAIVAMASGIVLTTARAFWPHPWRYSLPIEEQLEIESQEAGS